MIRVLLAKPGLDGHDRGIKVIAMALRDAGVEVIYIGLRRSAEQIIAAANEEDVDLIGISVLSGAHLPIARDLLNVRRQRRLDDVPVVMGGTIPRGDIQQLLDLGVTAVFRVGSPIEEVVSGIVQAAQTREGVRQ